MSNNAENEGGDIHGDNNASNVGGSIHGDNNASNEGGSIGGDHHHHGDSGDPSVVHPAPAPDPTHGDEVGGYAGLLPTDGVTLAFPVHHGLDTRDTISMLYNPITGIQYLPGIVAGDYTTIHTSDDVTTFVFVAPAPLPGTVRAVIVGVQ